ncbi:MAG: DUF4920 domain-containing protein [Bacteroidetes bacterium]|nr:MAG: DUF4920 domain-containing protein [Bacteroidota bacterium]
MRSIVLSTLVFVLAACGGERPEAADSAAAYDVYDLYGEAFAPDDAVPVEAVLAERDAYVGRPVKVEGRVAEVCQAAGCWLTLQAEDGNIRIHVPRDEEGAYVFTVPTDLSGKRVVVYGELTTEEVTEAMHDHDEEDAGHAMHEGEGHDADAGHAMHEGEGHHAEAGEAPRTELQMIASGVLVEKGETAAGA